MSLFKKIFGEITKETVSKLKWIPLTDVSQLDAISIGEKPIGIFKHSTRCGTSRFIKRQFETNFELDAGHIDMYYLDLLSYRDISNELASKYNVRHESPQLLIIKNDELVADSSHSGIHDIVLQDYL